MFTGIGDPSAAVEHVANQLLADAGVDVPPVPLELLASFQGITVVKTVDMPRSGMLIPLPSGDLEVRLRISDSPGRRNFSLAHEIGHTLMPNYSEGPKEKVDLYTGEFVDGNEEEFFCDVAARALLLPKEMFVGRCSELEPSIDNMLALAEEFACSLEATALRLDQLQPWPCVAVVWEMQLKPAQVKTRHNVALPGLEDMSVPQEEYRVKYHAGEDSGLFFPRFKHVDRSNDMIAGCLAETFFRGKCVLPGAKKDVVRYVEAVAVPYRDEHLTQRNRIISLVYQTEESACESAERAERLPVD
ncbi:MAG: ImmA/IrrE family metallo-endopeptidase [Armatimonadetes bacterium]|nr:ImmA/IrrE family metallo-endopeptidase [Armatimonadota bacterium]